jgi:uncharacterized membrane protein (UPF0127 family)
MLRLSKFSFILLLIFSASPTAGLEYFPRVSLMLKDKLYDLEIADTPARKSQGLMFRNSLGGNAGMLFSFNESGGLYIWMKNTLIPLTVLWLDDNARVIHIERLQPCKADPCPSYGPDQPARYVIELHGDEWKRFTLGDFLPAIQRWQAAR